jgi:hypothetical protein
MVISVLISLRPCWPTGRCTQIANSMRLGDSPFGKTVSHKPRCDLPVCGVASHVGPSKLLAPPRATDGHHAQNLLEQTFEDRTFLF